MNAHTMSEAEVRLTRALRTPRGWNGSDRDPSEGASMHAYMLATADAEARFVDQSRSLLDSLQEAVTNLREAIERPAETTVATYQRMWGEIQYLTAMAAPIAEGPQLPTNRYTDEGEPF